MGFQWFGLHLVPVWSKLVTKFAPYVIEQGEKEGMVFMEGFGKPKTHTSDNVLVHCKNYTGEKTDFRFGGSLYNTINHKILDIQVNNLC